MQSKDIKDKSQGEYLLDFFSHDRVFKIPEYQRKYKWTPEKNLSGICRTVFKLIQKDINSAFLGTFTLKENEKKNSVLLIDGQQRTTTLYILLKVLSDINRTYIHPLKGPIWSEATADTLNKLLFIPNEDDTTKSKLKIKASEDMKSLRVLLEKQDRTFKEIMQNKIQFKGGTNYYKNYWYLFEEVMKWITKHEITISQIVQALQKIWITTILLDKKDDELSIFESINALGTPLTAIELLKNYLFIKIRNDINSPNKKLYKQKITELFEVEIISALKGDKKIKPDQEDKKKNIFIRVYLIHKKVFVEEKNDGKLPIANNPQDIYDNFKLIIENLFNDLKTEEDLKSFLLDFEKFLTFYKKIKSLNKITAGSDFETSIALQNNSFIGSQIFPVILQAAILTGWEFSDDGKELSSEVPEKFKKIIEIIEGYLIKRNSVGQGARTITRRIEQIRFIKLDEFYETFIDGQTTISTNEFIESIRSSSSISEVMSTDSLTALLWKVEIYKNPKMEGVRNLEPSANFKLDYIMPKSLISKNSNIEWISDIKMELGDYSVPTHEQLLLRYENSIKSIGNITLLKTKIDERTKKIERKFSSKQKDLYAESQLKLNQELMNYSRWGKLEIQKRTDEICEIAKKIWS